MANIEGFGMRDKTTCNHEDGYGTTPMVGITCFLCNGTLDASQSSIIRALELSDKIKRIMNTFIDDKLNTPLYSLCEYLLGIRTNIIVNTINGQEVRNE